MDGQLRKIVAGHARSYGKYKAFLRGYGDGCSISGTAEDREPEMRVKLRSDWVAVIETVRRKLEQTDPEKGEVFVRLFDLDGMGRGRDNRVIRLAMELNTSPANIYRWRENILDQLILAATQRGLLQPFDTVQAPDTEEKTLEG